jgi:hypothetical protein
LLPAAGWQDAPVDSVVLAGTAAAMATGLAGVFIRRLPGMGLIWAAVLVWASIENTGAAWAVFGIATFLALANHAAQHLLAGGRLAELAAPVRSVLMAAAVGGVGFVLARTLGLLAGFALGLYVAERRRLGVPRLSHRAERARAGRESIVELVSGVLVTAAWLVAVVG